MFIIYVYARSGAPSQALRNERTNEKLKYIRILKYMFEKKKKIVTTCIYIYIYTLIV